MNGTSLDMRQLMAKALKECATVAEAVALVERIKHLMGESSPRLDPPELPRPADANIAQHHRPTPAAKFTTKPRRRFVYATNAAQPWTPAQREQANQLLVEHKSYAQVAEAVGRSVKGVTMAISRGVLVLPKDYPSHKGAKAGYTSALQNGRNIRDYERAEAAVYGEETPTVNHKVVTISDVQKAISDMSF